MNDQEKLDAQKKILDDIINNHPYVVFQKAVDNVIFEMLRAFEPVAKAFKEAIDKINEAK